MTENVLRSAAVTRRHEFSLRPDADARSDLADQLGIRAVRKLAFAGVIQPEGASDLRLEAALGATVVQDCVVTGNPVTTRVDAPVLRRYLAGMEMPESDEAEMPDDDTAEPLPIEIDLAEVMAEALALELPPWPRSDGIEPVDMTVTEPGQVPMTDEDVKPFAGLKALRDQMKDGGSTDD